MVFDLATLRAVSWGGGFPGPGETAPASEEAIGSRASGPDRPGFKFWGIWGDSVHLRDP